MEAQPKTCELRPTSSFLTPLQFGLRITNLAYLLVVLTPKLWREMGFVGQPPIEGHELNLRLRFKSTKIWERCDAGAAQKQQQSEALPLHTTRDHQRYQQQLEFYHEGKEQVREFLSVPPPSSIANNGGKSNVPPPLLHLRRPHNQSSGFFLQDQNQYQQQGEKGGNRNQDHNNNNYYYTENRHRRRQENGGLLSDSDVYWATSVWIAGVCSLVILPRLLPDVTDRAWAEIYRFQGCCLLHHWMFTWLSALKRKHPACFLHRFDWLLERLVLIGNFASGRVIC